MPVPRQPQTKDGSFLALLDGGDAIAATRPDYKRRSLATAQPYLTVTSEKRPGDGVILVRVAGDLDISTVLPFRDAAFTAIGSRPPLLLLDLVALGHLDITGLNTLLSIGRVGKLMKVPVRVIPGEKIARLFTATRLGAQLPFATHETIMPPVAKENDAHP